MRSGRVEVARLAGLYRGRELHGPATVTLRGAEIEIALGTERLGIPLHALHGLRLVGDALELYLDTGDVLTMHGVAGDLAPLAAALLDAGHAVPELTLPLRAFGTPRRGATTDHDRFFAPLLAARRRAEEQAAVDEKLRAFEAGALREAVSGTLAEFARARYPRSAAEQRALRAELEDCAGPLLARLDGVERAERRVREADDETRLVRWREWTDALRLLFQGADACWVALTPTLRRAAPARSRWRWFRLGALAGPLAGPLLGAAGLAAPAYAQHVQLRFTDISADSLRARHFDVVSAGRGFAIVVADTSDRARLAALGWRGEALTAPGTPGAPAAQRVATPRVYRSFDDRARGIAYFLDSLARTNPRVHLDTLGLSVEGRPILAAKVGASGDASSRPNVLFVATYHAREWAAPEMALRLLAYLARAPGSDLRADSLVARRDVWIVPVVNPDGYEYTFTTDRLWRKNRRPNADGTFGVDLNRNHAYVWALDNAGSSPAPAAETYRGRSAESEPETKAIANFSRAHPPVLSVSYHSFTGLVLYPWGYRFGRLANDLGIFRALAGTDIQPAVRDRLSGSPRDHYHPAPGWNLYPTNGEYTDWAYAEQRTLAFTVELTSGYEGRAYYGFEFPDDEPHLATMFADNLPFALDVLDAAVNPAMARPLATGLSVEPLAIESVSPVVRVRVPRDAAAGTHVVQPAALPLSADAAAGVAAYTQRLVSTPVARPARVVIEGAGRRVRFDLLAATGAEASDAPWTAAGFARSALRIAGDSAWAAGDGTLRSPPIPVPAEADTVSVLFWTRYEGDGFDLAPHGEVRISTDGGATWALAGLVAGVALEYYPERVDVRGVAGRSLLIEFVARFGAPAPLWWLDEVTVVAHVPAAATDVASLPEASFRPAENPVRGGVARLAWPFGGLGGEMLIYDIAGRLVWRERVLGNAGQVAWNVSDSGAANGVYIVVLRAAGRTVRGKLFVARGAS